MKFNLVFLTVLTLSSFPLSAEIKEGSRMSEILATAKPDTLVVFDIDNTLIEPRQTLGSDQWLRAEITKQVAAGLQAGDVRSVAEAKSQESVLAAWKKIQLVTEVSAVEPGTPSLIDQRQSEGIVMMGLTARPVDLADRTREQLSRVQIFLDHRAPLRDDVKLKHEGDPNLQALYTRGILFGGNHSKGDLLVRFLESGRMTFRPKQILFIDDRAENVADVDHALDRYGKYPHTSYRYGALDAKVKGFDPAVAEVEWNHFQKILSDDEARIIKSASAAVSP
jgi:Protein of unknown function (DUF2608)